jgi:hypothetical protein
MASVFYFPAFMIFAVRCVRHSLELDLVKQEKSFTVMEKLNVINTGVQYLRHSPYSHKDQPVN